MTAGHDSYCTKCGSPLRPDQIFCSKCGTRRQQRSSEPTTGPAPESPAEHVPPHSEAPAPDSQLRAGAPVVVGRTSQAATAVSRGYEAVAQVAGMAGMGFALPWQRLAARQRPDIGAFLSAAAVPGAQRGIRASLKRPGIALAATAVLDLAVAVITGGTSALYNAIPRLVLAGATSVLSLVTGSKGGGVRKAAGMFAAVTAVAQLGFALYTLISGLDAGTSGWVIAPQVIAMASSLVMAIKTMTVAFRRP